MLNGRACESEAHVWEEEKAVKCLNGRPISLGSGLLGDGEGVGLSVVLVDEVESVCSSALVLAAMKDKTAARAKGRRIMMIREEGSRVNGYQSKAPCQ